MEITVSTQFVILSLHPEKGRILIDNIRFRYSLTGAILMDFLDNGEITLSENKLIPRLNKNGDPVHDLFADIFEKSSKQRRISYWVQKLTRKSRFVFKETTDALINRGMLRHEKRYFLNIIPYNRYFLTDNRLRTGIIDEIREVLLNDKPATRKQGMLIGLIKASRAHGLLAKGKEENRILRKKCNDFRQNDPMASEIDKAIREVQAAIIASVTAASVAASSSH